MDEDDRRRMCESPTTRPVVLNAFAQSFASEFFKDRESEGIVICNAIPGVLAIYVNRKVLIRFNRLTNDHIVRCDSSTPSKRTYFLQEPMPKLDNNATRITCGYTLDAAKVDVEQIELSLQVGSDPVYHFQIDDQAGGMLTIPEPISPPVLELPTKKSRLRAPIGRII